MAKTKATDIPMESTDEYSRGYKTVPAPATNKKNAVPAYPPDTQGQPQHARKVWNKTRPVPGGRPAPAPVQKTVIEPPTPRTGSGPGYDDPSGVKNPTANLDGLTKKRSL